MFIWCPQFRRNTHITFSLEKELTPKKSGVKESSLLREDSPNDPTISKMEKRRQKNASLQM